jgi:dimethylamine/trimethylamine dehydrogenase
VIVGRRLTAADVLDYGAEIVVVATGSAWAADGTQPVGKPKIDGASRALTPEQVMAGARPPGRTVVVYDTDGYYVAPGIAELLAGEGYQTHLVTPASRVSAVSDETLEGDQLRRHLHGVGITFHVDVAIHQVADAHVSGETGLGDPWSLPTSGVVLVTQQRSERTLYDELTADPAALQVVGIRTVHIIGDALAPRMPSEAVFDGHRLAREIEDPHPMSPRPYRVERPAL